ncbi:MAG TPA: hypothetical protein VK601_27260 [Kofleriaceae bacterium]|nr:hypothetical protein [Kofleriaceae bacterium]
MSVSPSIAARGGLVVALAACGSVRSGTSDAAAPADTGPADAWASSCAPAALLTTVESADPGFGNACVHGAWFLQAFSGTSVPTASGRPDNTAPVVPTAITIGTDPLDQSSTYAVHVSGAGQENTGTMFAYAQLTASLNALTATQIGTVDVTAYTGVQFYAIVNVGATGARFTVANLFTDPLGGRCTATPGQPNSCFDHPGLALAASTTWTKYQIPFASLTQVGFGNQSPLGAMFPKGAITLVKWDIGIPSTGATSAWDVWVDDLTFY